MLSMEKGSFVVTVRLFTLIEFAFEQYFWLIYRQTFLSQYGSTKKYGQTVKTT